jgi:hypothetical protein
MKRRLYILTVLVILATPGAANGSTGAWGVEIQRTTVNPDHSVTIEWTVESVNVSVTAITVDYRVVGSTFMTRLTTAPLSSGSHTITIDATEIFLSNTYFGASCERYSDSVSWRCRRPWHRSVLVSVPSETKTLCVVPSVVGLTLKDAKARITAAKCSVGAVTRAKSKWAASTVLAQRPEPSMRLAARTLIKLVVSNGRART